MRDLIGGLLDVQKMSVRTRTTLGRGIRDGFDWLASVAAVGPDDDRGRRFGAFGAGSCITFPQGPSFNEHAIRIGRDTLIGPHVILTAGMAPGQPLEHDPVVVIGDRCNIGRGSSIVGHHSITIGDDITTGPYVYVTDQNHVYADPDVPIAAQWPSEEPVVIGSGCWLGTGCVVLPGSHLGRNVVVAANAVVRGEVPDHSGVAGAPAKVVRRYEDGEWVPPLRPVPINPPKGWTG
jgi:acetyltransferase-like isoleucine patch superfamily enzyme